MSASELLPEAPEEPSLQEARNFDYASLDSETRIVVQQRTGEIKNLVRRNAQDIVDIGQKLTEVKEQLGHGHFRKWLRAEFNWSVSAATKFMQVSEQFKCVNFTHLEIAASALYLLAAPSTPEDARQEALEFASYGETITHSRAKAIASRYAKPRRDKPVTVDIPASVLERKPFTLAEAEPSEDKFVEIEPTRYATPQQTSEEEAKDTPVTGGERDEQEVLEKPEKVLDKLAEVVEVTGGKSGNGHLNARADGTLVLPDTGRNHSDLADVGNRPSANPPLAKANNKISEICKVLSEGNFSKEELSNVVEAG